MTLGPYSRGCAWLWVRQVRVEGQQQRGAFLDNADPSVPVAVHAALVPFGLAEPAFQVEGVLGQVGVLTSNKQPRRKAGHAMAHMVSDRIVARVALLLQDLTLRLTLGTRATLRFACRLDRSHILHGGTQSLLRIMARRQTPVNVARSTRKTRVCRPPVFASRWRWSAARTSSKASAMRRPGGCRGPPWSSCRMPRTAAQYSSTTS